MSRRFSAIVPRVRSKRFVSHAVRHKSWQTRLLVVNKEKFTVEFSLRKKLSAICFGRIPRAWPPPCVRLESALAGAPNLPWDRLASTMRPPQTLSALCPPCLQAVSALATTPYTLFAMYAMSFALARHVSFMCPPCVHLVAAFMFCQFPLRGKRPAGRDLL